MKMAFGYEANSWERTWGMQSLSVTYCYNYGFVRKRKKSEDKNVMINNNAELNDSWLKTGFVNTENCVYANLLTISNACNAQFKTPASSWNYNDQSFWKYAVLDWLLDKFSDEDILAHF